MRRIYVFLVVWNFSSGHVFASNWINIAPKKFPFINDPSNISFFFLCWAVIRVRHNCAPSKYNKRSNVFRINHGHVISILLSHMKKYEWAFWNEKQYRHMPLSTLHDLQLVVIRMWKSIENLYRKIQFESIFSLWQVLSIETNIKVFSFVEKKE